VAMSGRYEEGATLSSTPKTVSQPPGRIDVMDFPDDSFSDELVAEALDELVRLALEAAERFADRRYLETLASLAAMEPLKSILVEQCSERWAAGSSPGEAEGNGKVLSFGYV